MYHAAMGAMQGMTPDQIYDRIADVLMDTQKAQWVGGKMARRHPCKMEYCIFDIWCFVSHYDVRLSL